MLLPASKLSWQSLLQATESLNLILKPEEHICKVINKFTLLIIVEA